MTRVKKGVNALKYRRSILKSVKGYRFGRSTKEKMAQEAVFHAGSSSFAHRRDKKNDFRKLWNVRINAASRPLGITYSKLIGGLKKKNIAVNRKMLADLAKTQPEAFAKIIALAK